MFAKYQKKLREMTRLSSVDALADYKYYDMHVVIERALEVVERILLNDTRKIDIVVLWVDGSDTEFIREKQAVTGQMSK